MARQASRAFESNATRDAVKLGSMPFEIARKGHRISVATQECGVGRGYRPCRRPSYLPILLTLLDLKVYYLKVVA